MKNKPVENKTPTNDLPIEEPISDTEENITG